MMYWKDKTFLYIIPPRHQCFFGIFFTINTVAIRFHVYLL